MTADTGMGLDVNADDPFEDPHCEVDCSSMFAVKGTFRFIEKILHHVLRSLPNWKEEKTWIVSLILFFDSVQGRTAFVMDSNLGPELSCLFATGPGKLDGTGREWRSFAKSMEWLEPRFPTIVTRWPYNEDQPEVEEDDDEAHVPDFDPRELSKRKLIISRALNNATSRGYLELPKIVSSWIGHLENLSTGCDCHREFVRELFPKGFRCPLEGHRLIDVASGELDPFVDELMTWSHGLLLAKLPPDIAAAGTNMIVTEFCY